MEIESTKPNYIFDLIGDPSGIITINAAEKMFLTDPSFVYLVNRRIAGQIDDILEATGLDLDDLSGEVIFADNYLTSPLYRKEVEQYLEAKEAMARQTGKTGLALTDLLLEVKATTPKKSPAPKKTTPTAKKTTPAPKKTTPAPKKTTPTPKKKEVEEVEEEEAAEEEAEEEEEEAEEEEDEEEQGIYTRDELDTFRVSDLKAIIGQHKKQMNNQGQMTKITQKGNRGELIEKILSEGITKIEGKVPTPKTGTIKPQFTAPVGGKVLTPQQFAALGRTDMQDYLRSIGTKPSGRSKVEMVVLYQTLYPGIKGVKTAVKSKGEPLIPPGTTVRTPVVRTTPTKAASTPTKKSTPTTAVPYTTFYKLNELNDYKIPELKDILRERGLPVSATSKAELIKRILGHQVDQMPSSKTGKVRLTPERAQKSEEQIKKEVMDPNHDRFVIFSGAADVSPGEGSGEIVGDLNKYIELSEYTNWRRKLSNAWMQPFKIGDQIWNSVEHYYQGSKFRQGNSEYADSFAVESGSELSKSADLAKAAGTISGKQGNKQIRPVDISIDPTFFKGVGDAYMRAGLLAKFSQNGDLAKVLLATKDAYLTLRTRAVPDKKIEAKLERIIPLEAVRSRIDRIEEAEVAAEVVAEEEEEGEEAEEEAPKPVAPVKITSTGVPFRTTSKAPVKTAPVKAAPVRTTETETIVEGKEEEEEESAEEVAEEEVAEEEVAEEEEGAFNQLMSSYNVDPNFQPFDYEKNKEQYDFLSNYYTGAELYSKAGPYIVYRNSISPEDLSKVDAHIVTLSPDQVIKFIDDIINQSSDLQQLLFYWMLYFDPKNANPGYVEALMTEYPEGTEAQLWNFLFNEYVAKKT